MLFLNCIFTGLLIYATLYAIVGKSAAPGGQLFSLIVLTIAANFGGWLFGLTTMPRLIGMLITGIIMQNIGAVNIDGIDKVTSHLRKFALVIILTRAGLEMDPEAFKKVWPTIIKLSILPWIAEAAVNGILCHFLFDMPWMWCLLFGAIIAAVSPAVVVPCLFRLRTKGNKNSHFCIRRSKLNMSTHLCRLWCGERYPNIDCCCCWHL